MLEMGDVAKRLEHLLGVLEARSTSCRSRRRIRGRVKRQMEKSQREYYLNEQVKRSRRNSARATRTRPRRDGEEDQAARMSKRPRPRRSRVEEAQDDVADVAEATVVRNLIDTLVGCPGGRRARSTRTSATPSSARRPTTTPREVKERSSSTSRAAARRPPEGADPLPGRPRRRGQDLARQSIAKATNASSCACRSARARRGGDPRPRRTYIG